MAKQNAPIAPAALDGLAVAAAAAADALEAAKAADRAAREALLQGMQQAGLERAQTLAGLVSVCKGRRTVSVVCPKLKAQLKLLQEQGLTYGASVERIGDPYITIRA